MNYINELQQMRTDALEMLPCLGDKHQHDETVLFVRQIDSLLTRDAITAEDMQILREHY